MIGSALPDRARVVRIVRRDVRVEGSYQTATSHGPWFRCRFDPGGEGEQRSAGGIRRTRDAQLLIGRRALDGSKVQLVGSDVVEIESKALGTLSMQLSGAPEPIVARRSIVGWVATLSQVDKKAAG